MPVEVGFVLVRKPLLEHFDLVEDGIVPFPYGTIEGTMVAVVVATASLLVAPELKEARAPVVAAQAAQSVTVEPAAVTVTVMAATVSVTVTAAGQVSLPLPDGTAEDPTGLFAEADKIAAVVEALAEGLAVEAYWIVTVFTWVDVPAMVVV